MSNSDKFLRNLGILLVFLWGIMLLVMFITMEEMEILLPLAYLLGGGIAFPIYFLLLKFTSKYNYLKFIVTLGYLSIVAYFFFFHDYKY